MNKTSLLALVLLLGFAPSSITTWAADGGKSKPKYKFDVYDYFNAGDIFGDMEKSAREFKKEMEGNKRYQHEKAGEEFLEQQKFQEAIQEFDAAIKLDPAAQTVYVKKGIALVHSGRPQEALINFDTAIKNNKRGNVWLWWPFYHKGAALSLLGRSKEAVGVLSRSIEINPNAGAYLWRSIAYGQLNQLDKASDDIEAGLKLRPRDPGLLSASAQLKQFQLKKAFLDKMAAKKGAQTTGSGLIYFVLERGSGPSPKATDKVKVHYHGTLPDGTVFDSSVNRGHPASFRLNQVIACWTEGLQKMQLGGKSRLVCPARIAYGNRSAGAKIKPGATLLFDVELLGIE